MNRLEKEAGSKRLNSSRSSNVILDPTEETTKKTWRSLPNYHKKRVAKICRNLLFGKSYMEMGGKKIIRRPGFVRFEIGRRYRLLCVVTSSQLLPLKVVSHETYNHIYKKK